MAIDLGLIRHCNFVTSGEVSEIIWGQCHGLPAYCIGVCLTLRHLRRRQRLKTVLDQFDLLLSTVDRHLSLSTWCACTASRVNLPADRTNSLSVFGTWRVAEAVMFDEAFGTAARRDSTSTASLKFPPTCFKFLKNWKKTVNSSECFCCGNSPVIHGFKWLNSDRTACSWHVCLHLLMSVDDIQKKLP